MTVWECMKMLGRHKKVTILTERGYESFEEFAELMDVVTVCDNLCELTIPQLTEFLRLYDEDLEDCGRDYAICDEALLTIPKGVESVWIEWG